MRNSAEEEDKRELYDAMFSCPGLDLTLPSVKSAPDRPLIWWLELIVELHPDEFDALAEHLPRYRDTHPDTPAFPGLDAYPKANKPS